jgi:mannose-6-phosphate isomerase-like protein (cupin superfamily)
MSAHALAPGAGRPFGPGINVKIEFGQSHDFAAFESNLPPSWAGPPPHKHHAYDEAFYVIEGSVTFVFDAGPQTYPARSFIFVPRGTTHTFGNPSPRPARILVVTTPGAIRLVEAIHQFTGAGGEPDTAVMASLYAHHQSEIVTTDDSSHHPGTTPARHPR